jgi:hypothetical protein
MRTGSDFPRRGYRRGAHWMTALMQYLSNLPHREDGEKASGARPDCEPCQLVFVELGNFIDRHVRLSGQGFDGALMCGTFARLRGRGKPVHVSLSLCVTESPGCQGESIS